MATLLVIEDEEVLARNLRRTLEKLGHTVVLAATGAEAHRSFAEVRPDLTLLDFRLPDANGLEILEQVKKVDPGAVVLMMTAYASVEDAVKAIKLGARDYLQKPLNLDDLRHAVERALHEAKLEHEVSYYRERESRHTGLEALVGQCEAMGQLRERIRRLCSLPPTAAPPTVFIGGETGVGKGLVARVLHYNGPRSNQPFIEVNCAAIAENLVEAELFGHERGAFTDARESKVGLFQAADNGTLFLDEIGCLTSPLQQKLLKAIEEKRFRPVGARAERSVDIQIVAATNSSLEEMVRSGSFREDLYYRLQVAPLMVPPLRERGDDSLLLAERFLEEVCMRYRAGRRALSADAKAAIRSYKWPGNVRELRNVLDRAVLFSDGETIAAGALGLPAVAPETALTADPESGLRIRIPDSGLKFEDLEKSVLIAALEKTSGNQSEAARLLSMSRDTFRYRLEKFGIEK